MHRNRSNLFALGALLAGTSFMALPSFAATPVDLSHHKLNTLQSLMSNMHETQRLMGPGNKLHVRVKQTYLGYPVWGADAILHIPNGAKTGKAMSNVMASAASNKATMNGVVYKNLEADLAKAPAQVFSKAQAQKALQAAVDQFSHKMGSQVNVKDEESKLMVYVGDDNKAHWAFKVSFNVDPLKDGMMPQNPIFIMDAKTFEVYKNWDNVHTAIQADPSGDIVNGGGFGGNNTVGKLTYDGGAGNLPSFKMTRDASSNTCYLFNSLVRVKRVRGNNEIVSVPCAGTDASHNNVYWTANLDEARGGYSPVNDGMYTAQLMDNLFHTWYHMPMIAKDGQPMQMAMIYHFKMNNAIYANGVLSMGDGVTWEFYPFTTRDIIAHEMAHGLVEQYSHLSYIGDSGALDEAFGDMTAKAAEYFVNGTNTWTYGADVVTTPGKAIRYLDRPSRDCGSRAPGDNCSIDHMSQYQPNLFNHFKAGVFNRLFYIISTTPGWNTKVAYDIMLNANMHYWTENSTFQSAACGIISATKDLHYDVSTINNSLMMVGINYADC